MKATPSLIHLPNGPITQNAIQIDELIINNGLNTNETQSGITFFNSFSTLTAKALTNMIVNTWPW